MSEEPKRRGRPLIDPTDRSERLHVLVPSDLHDRACRVAMQHGTSVAAVVREAIRRAVAPDDDSDAD